MKEEILRELGIFIKKENISHTSKEFPCELLDAGDYIYSLKLEDAVEYINSAKGKCDYFFSVYHPNIKVNSVSPYNLLLSPFNLASPIHIIKESDDRYYGIWKNIKNETEAVLPSLIVVTIGNRSKASLESFQSQDYPKDKIEYHFINSENEHEDSFKIKTENVNEYLQNLSSHAGKRSLFYLVHIENTVILGKTALKTAVKRMEEFNYPAMSIDFSDSTSVVKEVDISEFKENYILNLKQLNFSYYGSDSLVKNLSNSMSKKVLSSGFGYAVYTERPLIVPKVVNAPAVVNAPTVSNPIKVNAAYVNNTAGGFDSFKFFRDQNFRMPMVDKFYTQQLFNDAEINEIMRYASTLPLEKGTVGSREVHTVIRSSNVRWLPNNVHTFWIYKKISEVFAQANMEMWKFNLTGLTELIQFTEYEANEGYYSYHMDSGTKSSYRKISLTVQLSDPKDYEGGELQILTVKDPYTVPSDKGYATVFPSYMMHRVLPVTKGKRYSLVCWCSGPPMI